MQSAWKGKELIRGAARNSNNPKQRARGGGHGIKDRQEPIRWPGINVREKKKRLEEFEEELCILKKQVKLLSGESNAVGQEW